MARPPGTLAALGIRVHEHVSSLPGRRAHSRYLREWLELQGVPRRRHADVMARSGLYPRRLPTGHTLWHLRKVIAWELERTPGRKAPPARERCACCGSWYRRADVGPDPADW